MNTETRFYLIDTSDVSDDFDYIGCTDEEFIEMCEEKGSIYSLEGFKKAFNQQDISTIAHQLRIIEVPIAVFTMEITADTSLYSLNVCLQDILDNAPEEIKKAYAELPEEKQKELVRNNFHGAKTGFDFGICDPVSDVMSTIAYNLEF